MNKIEADGLMLDLVNYVLGLKEGQKYLKKYYNENSGKYLAVLEKIYEILNGKAGSERSAYFNDRQRKKELNGWLLNIRGIVR